MPQSTEHPHAFDRLLGAVEDWQDTRLTHGRALLLIALFSLPLFLVHLGTGDTRAMMELFNLVPVREAVRDGHWLVPTLNGAPRLEKPPLPVWLPGSLAEAFGSDNLWIVRIPSVLMGLITCWATYGIGCLISKDRKLGFWAALVLASTMIFIRQSRLASYDIFSTGFITIGFLGMLGLAEDAVNPNRADPGAPGRRFPWLWILLAGVGFGLSVMSKGPVPAATVCVPFAIWLLIFHLKRPAIWLYILIAAIVSVAVFLPWLLAAAARYPNAWSKWQGEFLQFTAAEGEEYRAVWYYYFGIFGFIFPWTVALLGALPLPFFPAKSDPMPTTQEKQGRWLLLLVLILGLVMLSIPHEKKQRYALQHVPIAALLIAALWQEFSRLRKTEPIDAPAKLLLSAQAALVIGTGLAAGLLVVAANLPSSIMEHWISIAPIKMRAGLADAPHQLQMAVAVFGVFGWIVIGAAVVALGCMAAMAQNRRRFSAAFVIYLLASWIIMLACYWTYRAGEGFQVNEYRAEAVLIDQTAGPNPIYSLPHTSPWLNTLYYANRTMAETDPPLIIAKAQQWPGPVYVLARDDGQPDHWASRQAILDQIAQATGRKMSLTKTFSDSHVGMLKLYRMDNP